MTLLYDDDRRRTRERFEKAVAANPPFVTFLVLLAAAEELDGDGDGACRSLARAHQMTSQLSIARAEQQLAPPSRVHEGYTAWGKCPRSSQSS